MANFSILKRTLILLFLLLGGVVVARQPIADQDIEQRSLELHFAYANYLGVKFDTMVNLALYSEVFDWIGTPYVYSGQSKTGTDCSGFVSSVCKQVYGCDLAASSSDILKQDVQRTPSGELCEGDLVFFKIRRKSVSHVGIYLGNRLFAHASRGQGVVISSLDEPYYARYFYTGGHLKH